MALRRRRAIIHYCCSCPRMPSSSHHLGALICEELKLSRTGQSTSPKLANRPLSLHITIHKAVPAISPLPAKPLALSCSRGSPQHNHIHQTSLYLTLLPPLSPLISMPSSSGYGSSNSVPPAVACLTYGGRYAESLLPRDLVLTCWEEEKFLPRVGEGSIRVRSIMRVISISSEWGRFVR